MRIFFPERTVMPKTLKPNTIPMAFLRGLIKDSFFFNDHPTNNTKDKDHQIPKHIEKRQSHLTSSFKYSFARRGIRRPKREFTTVMATLNSLFPFPTVVKVFGIDPWSHGQRRNPRKRRVPVLKIDPTQKREGDKPN